MDIPADDVSLISLFVQDEMPFAFYVFAKDVVFWDAMYFIVVSDFNALLMDYDGISRLL